MTDPSPHLLVAISPHGFGHLAQAAAVVNTLRQYRPELAVTVRTTLPRGVVAQRLPGPFAFQPEADDFGMVMQDAMRLDLAASLQRYQGLHADWEAQVGLVAHTLEAAGPDLILADIPYLTLAGAERAGIPAVALCSLNWRAILAPFVEASGQWGPILETMRQAYNSARCFLQPEPAMSMLELANGRAIGPVGQTRAARPAALHRTLGLVGSEPLVLVALGGVAYRLPLADRDFRPDLHWLVPAEWAQDHPNFHAIEALDWPFSDLLASVDAVVTKPGYGTFVEAAAAGRPLVTLDRPDWPETPALLDFLWSRARGFVVPTEDGGTGILQGVEAALEAGPYAPVPLTGNEEAAAVLDRLLQPSTLATG